MIYFFYLHLNNHFINMEQIKKKKALTYENKDLMFSLYQDLKYL